MTDLNEMTFLLQELKALVFIILRKSEVRPPLKKDHLVRAKNFLIWDLDRVILNTYLQKVAS